MINEINLAAREALKNGLLDNEVYDATVIEAFGSGVYGSSIEFYLDLPIKSIIALQPRDCFTFGSSWRDAVQGLHCQGWSDHRDEIINYFTSEIKDHSFPTPDSHLELRVGITGGATYCKLGMHRMIAAKAWLAYNHGENATLKQVHCFYRPLIESVKKIMEECVDKGYSLKFYHNSTGNENERARSKAIGFDYLVLVEKNNSVRDLYMLDKYSETLEPIKHCKNFFKTICRLDLRSKLLRLKFKEVPLALMKMMLDDRQFDGFFEKN
ncbi:hypothetical protein [Aeromonas veronii]